MDILSTTIIECLNTTLSSVLQLHLCPWCSKDQPVLCLVWLCETILAPVGPRSGNFAFIIKPTLIEGPHPQEVNYLAGKEAPSSVLINYLWYYNYSDYGTDRPTDIYISREISIEHPSVGLASLVQLLY